MERRFEQLESENRTLRRRVTMMGVGVALVLGLAAAVIIFSARYGLPGSAASEVAARQFTLRDADGRVRGIWGGGDDGSVRLVMQDAAANPRLKLNLLADGSAGISFADSAGRVRAVFAILPDASVSMVIGDEMGTSRSVLGLSATGAATIAFADRNGNTRAGLGVDSRGVGSFTLDERGTGGERVAEPETPTGTPDSAAAE
jgi:hypothetical protein